MIPPPDPLIQRQSIPLNPPKFGRNNIYISLSPFNYKTSKTEEFTLKKRDHFTCTDRDYSLDIYINSYKVLKNILILYIQLMTPLLKQLVQLVRLMYA